MAAQEHPGCLYVSFLHQRQLVDDSTIDLILARTMGDLALLRGQLAHLSQYLALLFDAQPRARTRTSAISVAFPSGTSTTQTST